MILPWCFCINFFGWQDYSTLSRLRKSKPPLKGKILKTVTPYCHLEGIGISSPRYSSPGNIQSYYLKNCLYFNIQNFGGNQSNLKMIHKPGQTKTIHCLDGRWEGDEDGQKVRLTGVFFIWCIRNIRYKIVLSHGKHSRGEHIQL